MTTVLACDPGSTSSAWVLLKDGCPVRWAKEPNETVLDKVNTAAAKDIADVLVIESVSHMGMAVGAEVFETVWWTGRFAQSWTCGDPDKPFVRISRGDVKLHICGSHRAKDANIRRAVLDRFGGDAALAPAQKCSMCRGRKDLRCLYCNGGSKARLACISCEHTGRQQCPECRGSGIGAPAGVLHGMSGDCWQALALAICYVEQQGSVKHDVEG